MLPGRLLCCPVFHLDCSMVDCSMASSCCSLMPGLQPLFGCRHPVADGARRLIIIPAYSRLVGVVAFYGPAIVVAQHYQRAVGLVKGSQRFTDGQFLIGGEASGG